LNPSKLQSADAALSSPFALEVVSKKIHQRSLILFTFFDKFANAASINKPFY
jgi:hypothetical protein